MSFISVLGDIGNGIVAGINGLAEAAEQANRPRYFITPTAGFPATKFTVFRFDPSVGEATEIASYYDREEADALLATLSKAV